MGKRKFFKPGIWIAATATSAVLMTGLLVGGGFADRYAAQINSFFNTKEYELVKDPNSKEDTINQNLLRPILKEISLPTKTNNTNTIKKRLER